MDVILPAKAPNTTSTRELRLRVVARPDRLVEELLARLGLNLPTAPKIVQNVVEKTPLHFAQPLANQAMTFSD